MSTPTPWTPFDFILNGEFADADHLQNLVERVREKACASCGILLVYQAGKIFQSLMYVSHIETKTETWLQETLASCPVSDGDRTAIKHLLATPRTGPLRRLINGLRYTMFRQFDELYPGAPGCLLVPRLEPRHPVAAPNVAPAIGILCAQPTAEAPKGMVELLQELAVAVNASAPVYLRRIHGQQVRTRTIFAEVTSASEKPLDPTPAQLAPADDARAPSRISSFLADVLAKTEATQGTIFMLKDAPNKLMPVTCLGRAGKGFEACEATPIEVEKGRGLVSQVYRTAESLLFNNRKDFALMNQKTGIIPFASDPNLTSDAGLVVPIIDKSAQGTRIGVLQLEKSHSLAISWPRSIYPFSLWDFWFAQEAADCLSVAWTRGWNEDLYRSVKKIQSKFRHHRLRPLDVVNGSAQFASIPGELPSDFSDSRYNILDLLGPLCSTLPSISTCTVRVLSVDQTRLILLAMYPKGLEDKLCEPILLTSHYPMAQVMHSGEVIWGSSSELPVRLPGLESYISLPLFLDTRCVGVVTFASKFSNLFLRHYDHALRAATEAIAEAVEFSQTRTLASVLGRTTQVFKSIHELIKIPGRGLKRLEALNQVFKSVHAPSNISAHGVSRLEALEGLVASAAPPFPPSDLDVMWRSNLEAIREDLAVLERCLQEYGQARRPEVANPSVPQTRSIRELVEQACRQQKASQKLPVSNQHGYPPLVIDRDHIDQTTYDFSLDALRDLIRNAKRNLTVARHQAGSIAIHYRQLGGRSYGCITIRNPLLDPLPTVLRAPLYRQPVHKPWADNRLHYGAFLSGWLIRAIGGDVHLAGSTDTTFDVTVEIPLQTPSDQTHGKP